MVLTVGGHKAAGSHDQRPLQYFLCLPPVCKVSINFSALRLRNTSWKSIARLFLTQAELTIYLFLQISTILTSTLLIGSHCARSSIGQVAIPNFFRVLPYLFMHSEEALHCLGRNEWRNHMTCYWKLKRQTKRRQQVNTNSVCYELFHALPGNHKAIIDSQVPSNLWIWTMKKPCMSIRPTDMINRRVLQRPKVI